MSWVRYLVTDGALALTFPYIILVLPYAYRALDAGLSAIDVNTLAEAAEASARAGGPSSSRSSCRTCKSAILSAAFLSVALVLGEFTLASLFALRQPASGHAS